MNKPTHWLHYKFKTTCWKRKNASDVLNSCAIKYNITHRIKSSKNIDIHTFHFVSYSKELAKAMQLSQQQQQQARESTNVNQEEIKATNEAESRVMDKIESTREKASDSTKIHKLAQILQAHEKRQESSSNTSAAQSAKRSPPVPAERRHGTASAVSKRESSTWRSIRLLLHSFAWILFIIN